MAVRLSCMSCLEVVWAPGRVGAACELQQWCAVAARAAGAAAGVDWA